MVEHQAETRGCPGCGHATTALFPADVLAPVQYGPGVATLAVYLHQEQLLPVERTGRVLGEVFGCPISNGTLERMVARCADAVADSVAAIKQAVSAAAILHVDETGLSLNGKTAWLHVASGKLKLGDQALEEGDGVAFAEEAEVALTGVDEESEILLFDLA